jgi:hypothetical protein
MPEWGRDTPWRQGSLVSASDLLTAGVTLAGGEEGVVGVVASHDCDIANSPDIEPNIEIVLARLDQPENGNFSHGKNSRTLQINVHREGESHARAELSAVQKISVSKNNLIGVPVGETLGDDKQILQRWLASRYRRSAFSDDFDQRLDNTKLRAKLLDILKKHPSYIGGIFFEVDDGEEVAHAGEDDPYALRIHVLYVTNSDPQLAKTDAEAVCTKITDAFKGKCFQKGAWKWIELADCKSISDEALSLAQSSRWQRWNADHISYRTDPAGIVIDGDPVT